MKNYLRVKMVEAEPMTYGDYCQMCHIEPSPSMYYYEKGYRVIHPEPLDYHSWVRKEDFEKAYFQIEHPHKLTDKDIQRWLEKTDFHTYALPPDKPQNAIVQATMPNGFVSIESNLCVNSENYDHSHSVDMCKRKVEEKVWNLLGFVLKWAKNGLV